MVKNQFTSEHITVEGGEERVVVTINWVDAQGVELEAENLPPMFSKGILRIREWDTNIEDDYYIDYVIFRDYANNNLIYVWLTDQEDKYPNNKPSEVMDYLDKDVLGDCIFDIREMLLEDQNSIVFIDCLGGLSPMIWFAQLGIDLRNMTDEEIYSVMSSPKQVT